MAFNPLPEPIRFDAPKKGPHLAVFGAVHGDEPCGAQAILDFVPKIQSGALPLLAGSVTFVPVCNPLAHKRGTRYVDRNLNRDLRPREKTEAYEDSLANILCPILESCDFLLDLHSYNAQGPAFIWAGEESEAEKKFRRALGPTIELFGWEEAYAKLAGERKEVSGIGTTEYARRFGAVANTLECGFHQDPKAVPVALQAIRGALAHVGLCPREESLPATYSLERRIKMTEIFFRRDQGRFARSWAHLDSVGAGEPIAFAENGAPVTASEDGFVIFPNPDCRIGDEWFYFGTSA